jgi:glutamate-1-semialdehyde 2,1-aminomutase
MLEPATNLTPSPTFLQEVKSLCHAEGALFILDEMITGFRWHLNGAQTYFNIEPDLTTFGKAMANGFAVAALGGKREIMKIGGINEVGNQRVFLTSTTHGAEMSALGAFIKTVEIMKRDQVIDHIWKYGEKLINEFNKAAQSRQIDQYIYMEGSPCSPNYVTKGINNETSLELRTLFAEQMLDGGIIMPYVALSASHGDKELALTLDVIHKTMDIYKKALEGDVKKFLKSSPIKPVFRKYN